MSIFPRPNYSPVGAVALLGAAYALIKFVGFGLMEVGLAAMLIGLALYLMIDWSIARRSEERTREYEASQEDVKVLQELRMFAPEQLEQLKEMRIIRRHLMPAVGPARHLWNFQSSMNAPGMEFETSEVMAVWAVCTPDNFAPLSTWDDGTRRRNCAKAMHDRWYHEGYLIPATGNKPAVWKDNGWDKAREELEGAR
jgi:hypothetical protein